MFGGYCKLLRKYNFDQSCYNWIHKIDLSLRPYIISVFDPIGQFTNYNYSYPPRYVLAEYSLDYIQRVKLSKYQSLTFSIQKVIRCIQNLCRVFVCGNNNGMFTRSKKKLFFGIMLFVQPKTKP